MSGEAARLIDLVPADLRPLVPVHWHQFPPVQPLWNYSLGIVCALVCEYNIVCALVCVISLTANLTALYLFLRDRRLRTPSNMLIVNMTIADLIMTTNHPLFVYNALSGGAWRLGPLACRAYGLLGAIGGLGSILSLTAISWDRYRVIVLSLGAAPLTARRAAAVIAALWLYTLTFTALPLLGVGAYVPEGILNSCTFDYLDRSPANVAYIWTCVTFFFAVPLAAICYFYFHIIRAVREHERLLREQARRMSVTTLRSGSGAEQRRSLEVRIAKVALANVGVWALCWTPYCAVAALGASGRTALLTPLVSALPALVAKTACTYNPLVYALGHPRYRAALRAHLPRLARWAGARPAAAAGGGSAATGRRRSELTTVSSDTERRLQAVSYRP
ncbi:Compound eye opsin BCRH2 [Amphibalanus amphitrite]|uniref:Compound eye opsin BCRH2 n=1 Tax=Amphibalanus amphitrite TaxID=1232801 RepID=A0A6A4WWK7_AMPAM|nr:Compound eye opsin BCRH2 [Amphibalanus amphitrite]